MVQKSYKVLNGEINTGQKVVYKAKLKTIISFSMLTVYSF